MAALTFYSNFCSDPSSTTHQFHYFSPDFLPELGYLPPPQLVLDPAFDYIPSTINDSVFFPNDIPLFDDASSFLFSDVCPYYAAPVANEFAPVLTEFPCFDEFMFQCPKRQRAVMEQSFCYGGGGDVGGGGDCFPRPEFVSGLWDGGMDNVDMMGPEFVSGLWDGRMDNVDMMDNVGCSKTKQLTSPSNNLSAQTIAARERRRKITAKTQELGELVPGGNKMNTAEMLNSAFKYVKFLQAQVAILTLKEETEDLQILESAVIQEKLYSEEQCLVPKGFVQNLANLPEIQSHPSISNSINQILQRSS